MMGADDDVGRRGGIPSSTLSLLSVAVAVVVIVGEEEGMPNSNSSNDSGTTVGTPTNSNEFNCARNSAHSLRKLEKN
jgi:hypothetical protein